MKIIYKALVILSVLLFTTNIFAQTASITWSLYNTTQLTSESVGNVTGSTESISAGSGQFGMSVFDYSTDGQRLWEGTAGWIADSEESNRFIQFDALYTSGNSFTATNVSFNYGAAGINGHIQSNAYYSTDGWLTRTLLNSSPLSYPSPAMLQFTRNVSVAVAGGTTFSLRIYPFAILNSSPMSPTFAVHNNVVISGTTVAKKNCILQVTDVAGKWGKQILLRGALQVLGTPSKTYLPNKELTFYIDDIIVGKAATNANGIASIAYSIPQDSVSGSISFPQDSVAHSIRAEYAGDADYNAQSSTGKLIVVRHVTSVTVPPVIFIRGAQPVIVANLTDNDNDGKGVSNRELVFVITIGVVNDPPEIIIGSATTDVNGVASISYNMPSDSISHSIRVSFAGDANYSAQSGTGKLTSSLKNCIIQISDVIGKWGKSVLLIAKLQESDSLSNINLPNRIINFYQIAMGSQAGDIKKVFVNSGTTNENGMTSVMYTIPQDSVTHKFDPQPTDSTSNLIRVEFAGDANYYAQSSTGTLTIQKHVTSLTVLDKSGGLGETITLEAILTDNDENKKGVSNQVLKFSIISISGNGDTARVYVGSDSTNSSGVASLAYTLPAVWDDTDIVHFISVTFEFDQNYFAQRGAGMLTSTLVGVENNQLDIPTEFALFQNYPNPFNPTSTIKFEIPKTGFVNISVYDILGREVKELVNEVKNPGHFEIILDARELASGIYFYTIRTSDFSLSKKMILLR